MFGCAGLTYGEAKELMQSARDPLKGKPLQNNTRLYERQVRVGKRTMTGYAVQLHFTDVVTILPGDLYMLNHGGWQTVTTQDRIGTYSPIKPYSTKGEWWLTVRPDPSDPEPDYPHRTVPRVFHATNPGPEPVKQASKDCLAGEQHSVTNWERVMVRVEEIDGLERPWELAENSRRKVQPTRARDVLDHIDTMISHGYVWIQTWVTHETNYVDGPTWQHHDVHKPTRCPHCEEFGKVHRAWSERMNGASYGRGGGKGWKTYCLMLERYGSVEGWRDAWREDGKAVWRAQEEHRQWFKRNHIEWENGVIVDSNGYVSRKDAEEVFKRVRARERAAKKAQRELERREREQARVDAFKTKILTKREQARLEREAREQRELEQFKASVNTENLHIRLADALEHMRPLIG